MADFKDFIMVMSIAAAILGITLAGFPVNKYRKTLPVGAFGFVALVLGFALVTTFKWSDIAVEISGLKFELRQAHQTSAQLRSELNTKTEELAAVKQRIDSSRKEFTALIGSFKPSAQAEAAKLVATNIKFDGGANIPNLGTELIKATKNAGYTLVPSGTIELTRVWGNPDHLDPELKKWLQEEGLIPEDPENKQ